MISLILRIVKQMKNDKRALALILFAPILMISLLYFLLGESSYTPVIGLDTSVSSILVSALDEQGVDYVVLGDDEDSDQMLEDGRLDAVISFSYEGINIRMLEGDSTKASKITDMLKAAIVKTNPAGRMNMDYIYGRPGDTVFDNLGYILLGVLSFFFVFIISGISFVRERTSGTMERLMLSPIKRISVVLGYGVGYGIFAALQGIFIILFSRYVLHMDFSGSVFLAMMVMVLIASSAVLMGALISIFANNEFQVMQFIPIIIIPQMFFSGIIPIATLPFHLGLIAYIMPVYYGCSGLKDIIVKGYGMDRIWFNVAMLCAFNLVLLLLNTVALRKYRKL